MNERLKAIITIIVTAIVNILNVYGYAVDAGMAVNVVFSILSALTIVWSWWKNQNITIAAQRAQLYLKELKKGRHDAN